MPILSIHNTIEAAWIFFLLFWFAMSFAVKRTVRRLSLAGRTFQVAMGAVAYLLLFSDALEQGWRARRVVPPAQAWALAGVVLTYCGVAFACWARVILGRNWSAMVTVKQDHQLVRSGPYSIVRHPIYSGLLLAGLGTALAVGEVRGFLAVALAFVGWLIKSRSEERFMIEEFGDEYLEYRRRTGGLVPFIG